MTRPFVHIAVLIVAVFVCVPLALHADQAQYFYDELGRLVGVVDSTGNAAVYVYDEVGNLRGISAIRVSSGGDRDAPGGPLCDRQSAPEAGRARDLTPSQAPQYFYDELGPLVAVVDIAGDVAVYIYDEVGPSPFFSSCS